MAQAAGLRGSQHPHRDCHKTPKARGYIDLPIASLVGILTAKRSMLETYGGLVLPKVWRVVTGGAWGLRSVVATLLTFLLVLPPRLAAQPPAAATPPAPPQNRVTQPAASLPLPTGVLKIYVLEGQNQIHDIRDRVLAMVVVEVRDENDRPLEGTEVTFDLPAVGPGGAFAGQQFRFSTTTNVMGQAAATFSPNTETGRFNIRVRAAQGNRTGDAVISQSNARHAGVAEPKTGGLLKFAWWKIGLVAAVGATIGVIVATRGGGSAPSPTLFPGTPTFGPP